jgi:hypothetical protein
MSSRQLATSRLDWLAGWLLFRLCVCVSEGEMRAHRRLNHQISFRHSSSSHHLYGGPAIADRGGACARGDVGSREFVRGSGGSSLGVGLVDKRAKQTSWNGLSQNTETRWRHGRSAGPAARLERLGRPDVP